jgi:hypothetical protein
MQVFLIVALAVAVVALIIWVIVQAHKIADLELRLSAEKSDTKYWKNKYDAAQRDLSTEKRRNESKISEAASNARSFFTPAKSAPRPSAASRPAPAKSKSASVARPQSGRSSSSSYPSPRSSGYYDDSTANAFLYGALATSAMSDFGSSSSSSSYDSGSSSSSSYSGSSSSYDSGSSSSSSYDSGSSFSGGDSGSF